MSCLLQLLATATICLVALHVVRLVIRNLLGIRRIRRMTASLPGPPAYPFIGSVPYFLGDYIDFYDKFCALCNKYGPLFQLKLCHMTFVVVTEPDDIEAVLTCREFIDKPPVYGIVKQMLGTGMAFQDGDVWWSRRKALTPCMHLDILQNFVAIFQTCSAELATRLGKKADSGEVFDVRPFCGELANSAICESIMSSEVNEDDAGRIAFLDAVPRAVDFTVLRASQPWMYSEKVFSLSKHFPEYQRVKRALNEFTHGLIRAKKRSAERGEVPAGKRQVFLDHMISSNEARAIYNDAELADEVKSIVFLASSLSMDTLTFIIYTLAFRPDIQEAIRKEVESVLGANRKTVQSSDLPQLTYLECVVKEVLRYFSIISFFGRKCPRDFKLPSTGFVIPKDCQTVFWVPHVHMNPRFFPEPRKFDPDRFLSENAQGRHPFAFLAFSGGPRSCFGQKYAMMLLKTVIATLVTQLRFELPSYGPQRLEDVRLRMSLRPRDGANIRVSRRAPA